MIFISHRGNTEGRDESRENSPEHIDIAISKGFDVEIDVWAKGESIWLGHDAPERQIDAEWLAQRKDRLWVHCKNSEAASLLKKRMPELNFFWHQQDDLVMTSKGHIWAYPGKQPIEGSIAVMPEIFGDDLSECEGICSDFIAERREQFRGIR